MQNQRVREIDEKTENWIYRVSVLLNSIPQSSKKYHWEVKTALEEVLQEAGIDELVIVREKTILIEACFLQYPEISYNIQVSPTC